MKILRMILIVLSACSILAIVSVQIDACQHYLFAPTLQGLSTYFGLFISFKYIFAATFIVLSTYIALKTYKSMQLTNGIAIDALNESINSNKTAVDALAAMKTANDIAIKALKETKFSNQTATNALIEMKKSNGLATNSLKLLAESNIIMKKENEFQEWFYEVDYRMEKYFTDNQNNTKLMEIFIGQRRKIYNELYEHHFAIENKGQLTIFFNKYFLPYIDILELSSEYYIPCNCLYPDDNYTYSYDCARYLFLGLVDSNICYKDLQTDFQKLYQIKKEPYMIQRDEYYKLLNTYKTSKKN